MDADNFSYENKDSHAIVNMNLAELNSMPLALENEPVDNKKGKYHQNLNNVTEDAVNASDLQESEINQLLPHSSLLEHHSKDLPESGEDAECSVDDALDESCMGLEGTLERGFSLQEPSPNENERPVLYEKTKMSYSHEPRIFQRYKPTLKHLIPVRTDTCASHEMPVDATGMLSYTMYSWVTSLMWRAYKRGLQSSDVPICSKYDMCHYNTQRLERLWDEEVGRVGSAKASLQRVAWRFIRTRVYLGLMLFVVSLVLGFAGPTVFMRYLIDWLGSDAPRSTGLVWVLCLVACEAARTLTFGLVWAINYRTGVRLRAACLGLVYRKLLRIPGLGSKSVGEMINVFANDGQRIFELV
ncbi:ATP-binding cassette sub-family C member 5, partial [Hyalella azteca]|uniref:ATP-binding cassette sub-family C member 5 n=1 Tax=Hyalella azteca TaxID=294128 RepID=A0A8B7N6N4_HYAAZ